MMINSIVSQSAFNRNQNIPAFKNVSAKNTIDTPPVMPKMPYVSVSTILSAEDDIAINLKKGNRLAVKHSLEEILPETPSNVLRKRGFIDFKKGAYLKSKIRKKNNGQSSYKAHKQISKLGGSLLKENLCYLKKAIGR